MTIVPLSGKTGEVQNMIFPQTFLPDMELWLFSYEQKNHIDLLLCGYENVSVWHTEVHIDIMLLLL